MTLALKHHYLKIYMGCMYSGKSTSLLNEKSRYETITKNVLMVNHQLDKKRHLDMSITPEGYGEIRTHGNRSVNGVLMVNKLSEIIDYHYDSYLSADVIIIDEAQFFDDLLNFLRSEMEKMTSTKIFIIGGLSGDFKMQPIGQMLQLIPLADEVIKLNAYCSICKDGTIASFTKRLINDTDQILVGKNDIYTPVCRKHFL